MKIDNIKINSYGNLEKKEIKFNEKINIVHGLNESGKSTLLSYIVNMLYGISTNKDGKDLSDYEKFMPWSKNEFSGKIYYTLDNENKYEVFRDFSKKRPVIYNEKSEDISSNFEIDKKQGSKFFEEQTNLDKQMFLSTLVSMQQEVDLDEKSQNMLIQKIANLAGSGEDNVSYKKANDKLTMKIRDEIGSNKTSQKPINIVNEKIDEINKKINEIEPYVNEKYTIDEEKNEIKNIIEEKKVIKEVSQKLKLNLESSITIKTKIENDEKKKDENNKNLKDLYEEKEEYNKQKDSIDNEIKKSSKDNKNNFLFLLILLPIFVILDLIFIKNIIIKYCICGLMLVLFGIIIFIIKNKKNKIENNIEKLNKKNNDINNQIASINGKIELLEKENINIDNNTEKSNSNMNIEIENKKHLLLLEYKNKIDKDVLYNIIQSKNINEYIQNIDDEIKQKSIELNKIELEESTILSKLDEMIILKEEQSEYQNELKELKNKNDVLNIAIDTLKESYEEMKNTITPKFTQNLSNNIDKISNGKYKRVAIDENNNMIIEKENGEFIDASRLSLGTIDELYLSLRLSMIDDISKESMPIMLDESFAYFDDNRLENILNYLNAQSDRHQIIIFTCSKREIQILDKNNVNYNLIEM